MNKLRIEISGRIDDSVRTALRAVVRSTTLATIEKENPACLWIGTEHADVAHQFSTWLADREIAHQVKDLSSRVAQFALVLKLESGPKVLFSKRMSFDEASQLNLEADHAGRLSRWVEFKDVQGISQSERAELIGRSI